MIVPARLFSRVDLAELDGSTGLQLAVALAGRVYDVSSRRDLYGPDAVYSIFAGRVIGQAMFDTEEKSFPKSKKSFPKSKKAFQKAKKLFLFAEKFSCFCSSSAPKSNVNPRKSVVIVHP